MADNTVTTYATDDISSVHHPRVKLEFGPDGTVNDVSYSKPLPANVAIRGDALMIGSVSAAPARAIISCSSSATATIVAAQTSAQVRVLSYVFTVRATTSVTFGSSTTAQTGVMIFDKNGGAAANFNPYGHIQTATGQPLTITTGDGAVAGHVTYVMVSV